MCSLFFILISLNRILNEKYKQVFEEDWEGAMNGTHEFDDWQHMRLNENIKQDVDYIIIGKTVWY